MQLRRLAPGALTLALIACALIACALVPACAAAQMTPLTTSGNAILRGGQRFEFYGVNRDSLEWGDQNWNGCGGDGHFADADFDRIAAWHATAVRLPLSQADWLGRRCSNVDYPALVDAAVAKANARGMYAILDLHWTDDGGSAPCDNGCSSGEQPMPDSDSVTFWKQVAARYAGNPGVVFDLFDEPHDVSWSCWLHGGCSVTAATGGSWWSGPPSYTAVGMQALYDAVRGTGAQNLVLVPGLDWAYDLSGVTGGYALSGTGIAYDTHVYTKYHSTTSDWDQHFGSVAAKYPVTATELGTTDCSSDQTKALLDYLYAPGGDTAARIGWTIWGWSAPGECSQPSLLSDWSGSPLSSQGQLVHDTLAWLASQPAGTPAGAQTAPSATGAGTGGSSATASAAAAPAPDTGQRQTRPVAQSGPGTASRPARRTGRRRHRAGNRARHRSRHHAGRRGHRRGHARGRRR